MVLALLTHLTTGQRWLKPEYKPQHSGQSVEKKQLVIIQRCNWRFCFLLLKFPCISMISRLKWLSPSQCCRQREKSFACLESRIHRSSCCSSTFHRSVGQLSASGSWTDSWKWISSKGYPFKIKLCCHLSSAVTSLKSSLTLLVVDHTLDDLPDTIWVLVNVVSPGESAAHCTTSYNDVYNKVRCSVLTWSPC